MEVLHQSAIAAHGPNVDKARRSMLMFRSMPNMSRAHGPDAEDDRFCTLPGDVGCFTAVAFVGHDSTQMLTVVQNVRAAIKGAVLELPAMPKMTPKPGMFQNGHMRRLSRSMPSPSMQQALAEMVREEQPRAVDDSARKATLLAIMEDIQQVRTCTWWYVRAVLTTVTCLLP
eukprot:1550307-Rhodomonas_salina.2